MLSLTPLNGTSGTGMIMTFRFIFFTFEPREGEGERYLVLLHRITGCGEMQLGFYYV